MPLDLKMFRVIVLVRVRLPLSMYVVFYIFIPLRLVTNHLMTFSVVCYRFILGFLKLSPSSPPVIVHFSPPFSTVVPCTSVPARSYHLRRSFSVYPSSFLVSYQSRLVFTFRSVSRFFCPFFFALMLATVALSLIIDTSLRFFR